MKLDESNFRIVRKYIEKLQQKYIINIIPNINETIKKYFKIICQSTQIQLFQECCQQIQSPYGNEIAGGIIIKDSLVYCGSLLNGKKEGIGLLIESNGRFYHGIFQDDQKWEGYLVLKQGSIYHGQFLQDMPHGEGSVYQSNGETYIGQWQNGLKHGIGCWNGMMGEYYIGDWKLGQQNGLGEKRQQNQDCYMGEIQDNMKHGYGVEMFANGDVYIGNYVEDYPNGMGEYKWSNSAIYKGQFIQGVREGQGRYVKEGHQYQGNLLISIRGNYKKDMKQGYGKYKWPDGTKYEGNFNQDMRDGFGHMLWNDGTEYKGVWKNNKMNGQGIMIDNEQCIEGVWKDNVCIQQNTVKKKIIDILKSQRQALTLDHEESYKKIKIRTRANSEATKPFNKLPDNQRNKSVNDNKSGINKQAQLVYKTRPYKLKNFYQ
ncbi:hypothetical protein pb186bvf_008666 [Paramecium bursaria]